MTPCVAAGSTTTERLEPDRLILGGMTAGTVTEPALPRRVRVHVPAGHDPGQVGVLLPEALRWALGG